MQNLLALKNLFPLSREGILWFVASLAMLVTGLFKGINLITLLACWMVAVVFLNYWWARLQLRCLAARRLFPEAVFAGTPCSLLLQAQNTGSKSAFGIMVHDAGPAHQATRFLAHLGGRTTVTFTVPLEVPRRGLYRLAPLRLTTGYPLALVHLARLMPTADDLVVFPKLGALKRARLRRFLAQHSCTLGQARVYPRRHAGAQTEFHGLRPFRAGDSPRWIHWRTTARRGELMVREFEDMPNDHFVLIVDPGLPDPGLADNPVLERLLSLAATICWEWCRQQGDCLALAVAGREPAVLVGSTGHECAAAMLARLAVTGPGPLPNTPAFLDSLRGADLPPGPILVLSPAESELAAFVAQWLHRPVAHLNLGREEDKDFFE
jgi:uncharacterized protein (DUF58 family)